MACKTIKSSTVITEIIRMNTGQLYIFYAPNFEKVGSILLSACAFVCASVRSKKIITARSFKLGQLIEDDE